MLAWMMMGLIGPICIGSVVYLAARVRRFGPIQRLSKKRRALSWLIGFALVLIPTAALCLLWTPLNMAVCLLHLTLFWLLSDLVFALIRRLRHAAFKRAFTLASYQQFFADAGYTHVSYTLCEGRVPCAVAIILKQ